MGFVARFGSRAGNRTGFWEELPEASLMTDGASATSSKMDPPLAKAELSSDAGSDAL